MMQGDSLSVKKMYTTGKKITDGKELIVKFGEALKLLIKDYLVNDLHHSVEEIERQLSKI